MPEPKIPKHLKEYIKKTRASSKKQNKISQKQSSKQNQIVIIGDTSRRRGPNRPKSGGGGGGGSGGDLPRLVYAPSFPQQPQPPGAPAMQQPQAENLPIAQQVPQQVPQQFQPTPVYRNPFRREPFRTALNPPDFTENDPSQPNQEGNLPSIPIPRQNPILNPIVEEQNFVNFGSRPPAPFLQPLGNPRDSDDILNPPGYDVSTPTYSDAQIPTEIPTAQAVPRFEIPGRQPFPGMTRNEAVNQLNREVEEELRYTTRGGGGGGPTNRGRPFTSITQEDRYNLEMYYIHKHDKASKQGFTPEDLDRYNKGKKLATDKKKNPDVIRLKNELEFRMSRDSKL